MLPAELDQLLFNNYKQIRILLHSWTTRLPR
jgi:hypothetical protein